MYAEKGDILQFCLSEPDCLDTYETKYSFCFCPKNVTYEGQGIDVAVPNTDTEINRDFSRFNVVKSKRDNLTVNYIDLDEEGLEYANRPQSILVVLNPYEVDNTFDDDFYEDENEDEE